jgi:hypothetical protein
VLASRSSELVQELCDQVIVLSGGRIVDRGGAKGALRRYHAPSGPHPASADGGAKTRPIAMPKDVTGFNEKAALLWVTVDAEDGLWVEIRLETAVPDLEVQCGVSLVARGGGWGARIELPQPLSFPDPGAYTVVGQVAPGMLPRARYQVRADATVAAPGDAQASVIARDGGRIRITGDAAFDDEAPPPIGDWDGRTLHSVEAEWSVE